MGLFASIAEKVAFSAATSVFPPVGWAIKALGSVKAFLLWWFGDLARVLATMVAILIVLALHLASLVDERDKQLADQRKDFVTQQQGARHIAEMALMHQNAVSAANAAMLDHMHNKELADAHSALEQYVSAHRPSAARQLQPRADQGSAGRAGPAQNGDGAAVPAAVPADSVLVSVGDLQKCTDTVAYAIDAHNWSLTVNQVQP